MQTQLALEEMELILEEKNVNAALTFAMDYARHQGSNEVHLQWDTDPLNVRRNNLLKMLRGSIKALQALVGE